LAHIFHEILDIQTATVTATAGVQVSTTTDQLNFNRRHGNPKEGEIIARVSLNPALGEQYLMD
jgi:hypothetical protein